MTRLVFGLPVVDDQPTPSPISHAGRAVLWHQTRTLTLADGSTAYGCSHCEYVSRNRNSIRPHLVKHNRKESNGQIGGLPVKALIKQLSSVAHLTEDRDQWKSRALRAEKALAQLRDALTVANT